MKWWTWILFTTGVLIAFFAVDQYLFCPQYDFTPAHPFSGSQIYNPYADGDSMRWRKCNFHTHVRAWDGFTNGKGNAAFAWKKYDSLGYDVHCISNYESVNRYDCKDSNYIAAYEHGYGIFKNHENVLGTSHVLWSDYLLPQTLNDEEHVLADLRANGSPIIIINHPELRNAFTPFDLNFLSGYNCLEVFGHACNSTREWDAALSAGKPIFIVADDDAHNVNDPNEIARNCTWVDAPKLDSENIFHALKTGNDYGMIIGTQSKETFKEEIEQTKEGLPEIQSVTVCNDTLRLSVNKMAKQFQFIGQGGRTVATQSGGTFASYEIKPNDTYVRAQILFDDGTEICLNPVFRYNGKLSLTTIVPSEDETETIFLRLFGFAILAAISIVPFALRILRMKRTLRAH